MTDTNVQDAPVIEEGGQGDEGTSTPDYAGFSTPDELAAAYQDVHGNYEQLTGQVKELESLKGRQGSELGDLRQQLARLEGERTAWEKSQAAPTTTMADLDQRFNNDEITMAQYLSERDAIREREITGRVDQTLNEKLTSYQTQLQQELYAKEFMSKPENAGYEAAYNSGELDHLMKQGYSGDQAWARHRLESENTSLKQQLETKIKEAEAAGIQKGAQLKNQQTAAGKVIGDAGAGSFGDGRQTIVPRSRPDQRNAGVAVIERMRGQ